MRCYADNVLVELEPLPTMSAGGLHIINHCSACGGKGRQRSHGVDARCATCKGSGVSGKLGRGSRFARVLSSGPGYFAQTRGDANSTVEQPRRFVANETRPGDRVAVDAQAGQAWDGELSVPRHNPGNEFGEIGGIAGELRIVREQEILAVIYDE